MFCFCFCFDCIKYFILMLSAQSPLEMGYKYREKTNVYRHTCVNWYTLKWCTWKKQTIFFLSRCPLKSPFSTLFSLWVANHFFCIRLSYFHNIIYFLSLCVFLFLLYLVFFFPDHICESFVFTIHWNITYNDHRPTDSYLIPTILTPLGTAYTLIFYDIHKIC